MIRKEIIGGCELYLGDCREIIPTLTGIDAVISDPPYGIAHRRGTSGNRPGKQGGEAKTIAFDPIVGDDEPFDPAHLLQWPCILWGSNYYAQSLPVGRWLIWDKTFGGGAGDFSDAEMAWCSGGGATRTFRHLLMGVQRKSQVGEERQHPTEKPIALMEWCLGFFPNAATILDPYMGSGTTGVACVRVGRKYIGIEIDPKHFDTACKRIEAATKQPDLFIAEPDHPQSQQLSLMEPAE
jgi:DNA modification methylase